VQTVMEEKIKKAFDEWKNSEQLKESNVKEEAKTGILSKQLMAYIEAHPGVTGKQLRAIVIERSPETPVSYVPALLKGMFDKKVIRREPVGGDGMGRPTFAYYKLSDEEREAQLKPVKKTKKPKARVKPESKGITTLVLDAPKRHAVHPLEVGATTVSISIATADGTTYSLPLGEAKVIYTQLNQIFGGAR